MPDYEKAKPTWTTLLDIDALGKAENESFVFHGATCLFPQRKRCLVKLSKGGGDADTIRELDVEQKAFVSGGFTLPAAKHQIGWKDDNTIYIATDFGPGTLTNSGYPRIVKEWKRGTPLSAAQQIFEIPASEVGTACYRTFDHDRKRDFCQRDIDFENTDTFWLRDGKQVKLDKPSDAESDTWDDELLLRLKSDWTVGTPPVKYKAGSLLIANLEGFVRGDRKFQVLFEPTANVSLDHWTFTKTRLFLTTMQDVRNHVLSFSRKPGDQSVTRWSSVPLDEKTGSIAVEAFDPDRSDDVWLVLEDFTMPSSLVLFHPATGKREPVKQQPSFYDSTNAVATQYFATSKDGTRIPYTEVRHRGTSGAAPTVLDAYGGFELSMNPHYIATQGATWVDRGGVFVLANLRGGGEYGPRWHEAAMKHNRQRAYDDLAAVAEDLVRRGTTTRKQLGIVGASNGGLLTSVLLTQRPELFGAVVSKVPLTDMQRFHKLLAGASWMSEYGDPDNADDWAALAKYSPFHNVKPNQPYPPMFFTTSTKDDRVHPAHARKMVAKLEALGYAPLYYENIEGGHGGAADFKQRAYVDALVYTFFAETLGPLLTPSSLR